MIKNCKCCDKEINTLFKNTKYCSRACYDAYNYALKYANGIENTDYVVCKLCGMRVGRIYGKHMKKYHAEYSIHDYKMRYPNSPIRSIKDRRNSIKEYAGSHMKLEKYRTLAAEAINGVKNHNHKTRSTIQQRKSRSPFSIEFYKERYPDKSELELEKLRLDTIKSAIQKRILPSNIKYWILRGYNEIDAKEKVSECQRTFTKEKLIKKYGETLGLQKWTDRQIKWKNKIYNNNKCIGYACSNVSLQLFERIVKHYDTRKYTFLYGKNEKVIHDKISAYKYDFTIRENKKIIEFNGTFWHCDPRKYDANFFNKVKGKYAYELWKFDEYKTELAKMHGYDILCIWEADYDKDPDAVFKKCINFIESQYNT